MEDKLLELKEQFCNWYCPNRNQEVYEKSDCNGTCYCPECEESFICDYDPSASFEPCNYCIILEYIRHIRDELN